MFSPWYAWSGRRAPENHVCINVATYGAGGRFTMTDRGRAALRQSADTLTVGPSSMRWTGDRLVIDVDERGAPPFFGRVRGQVTVTPSAITTVELPLCDDGAHVWRPLAPTCTIEVALDTPGWEWSGHGYFDANFGTRALEADFDYWTWGRFPRAGGTTCFYDTILRGGTSRSVGLHFDPSGNASAVSVPQLGRAARSLWGVRRDVRADAGFEPHQVKPMLDAPFYCRSVMRTSINGTRTDGVHEALDLKRFRSPFLKPMLAMRVPRRARWNST